LADSIRLYLRRCAIPAFGLYAIWNVYWLSQARIPPSIAQAWFHLPVPTTGCLRSLLCLLRGELADSLYWNAFLLPLLFLLSSSAACLTVRLARRQDLLLPTTLGRLWLVILAAAWLTKALQGPDAW
jgi:hypothetical protein